MCKLKIKYGYKKFYLCFKKIHKYYYERFCTSYISLDLRK